MLVGKYRLSLNLFTPGNYLFLYRFGPVVKAGFALRALSETEQNSLFGALHPRRFEPKSTLERQFPWVHDVPRIEGLLNLTHHFQPVAVLFRHKRCELDANTVCVLH